MLLLSCIKTNITAYLLQVESSATVFKSQFCWWRLLATIISDQRRVRQIVIGFGLRPTSGESGAEGGEQRLANRSRSETARRRAADGSPPRLRSSANAVRDERGFLRRRTGAVERDTGRPADRETERKPALVTAGLTKCHKWRNEALHELKSSQVTIC